MSTLFAAVNGESLARCRISSGQALPIPALVVGDPQSHALTFALLREVQASAVVEIQPDGQRTGPGRGAIAGVAFREFPPASQGEVHDRETSGGDATPGVPGGVRRLHPAQA